MKIGITGFGDAGLDQSWQAREDSVDGIILVTKAPQVVRKFPARFVLHCTITGWGGTFMEPRVAPPEKTIPVYQRFVETHGPKKIVLRIDPIIPTEEGLERAKGVLQHARSRVRTSFVDSLPHVKERFKEAGFSLPWSTEHAPLALRQQILEELKEMSPYPIEVCDEPDIACTGCVSALDYDAMGLDCTDATLGNNHTKFCRCLASKQQLINHEMLRCRHDCLYCFWEHAE